MKKLDVFYYIMNKMTIIFTIFLFCHLLLPAAEVVFWCTADIHGVLFSGKNRGSMSKITSFLETHRNQGDITIDVGDLLQGSPHANATNGKLIVDAFNQMRYDFFIPGNHDLEFGPAVLRENLSRMKAVVLCANLKFQNPLPRMKPYTIVERSNIRIGIIGTGDRESRTRMLPCNEISFADEEKSIAQCLRDLRQEKVDMIVLARHGGIYFSGESLFSMLKKFPEIDLVIGGHSHQQESGRKIAGAYYVQPGAHCESIIEVKADFDKNTRKLKRITSRSHLIANQPSSRTLNSFYPEYNSINKAIYSNIKHRISPPPRNIHDVQKYLITNAVPSQIQADAYLFIIDESRLEWRNKLNGYLLYRMFPFENSIVTLNVNASEYKKIVAECRKYSQKYKTEMVLIPSGKKYLKLCTSTFILSGGGRNFPESRKITEKNLHSLKEYQSMRKTVSNFLQQN